MRDSEKENAVRVRLFSIWCGALIAYFGASLALSLKAGIDSSDAFKVAWQTAYMIMPVIGAFGGYWFGPQATENEKHQERRIKKDKIRIAYAITCVPHLLVWMVFFSGIAFQSFDPNAIPDASLLFSQGVDNFLKTLWLVWSVSLLPVGWLVHGQNIPGAKESDLTGLQDAPS